MKKPTRKIKARLEYLRGEILAERISYYEIAELEDLVKYIDPEDVLLLEWAGVEERSPSLNERCVASLERLVGFMERIDLGDTDLGDLEQAEWEDALYGARNVLKACEKWGINESLGSNRR
jgi:hypothetical protein